MIKIVSFSQNRVKEFSQMLPTVFLAQGFSIYLSFLKALNLLSSLKALKKKKSLEDPNLMAQMKNLVGIPDASCISVILTIEH